MSPVAKIGLALLGATAVVGVLVVSRSASAKAPDVAPAGSHCGRTDFAGMRFIEVMTGGASSTDDVPVHVALHGLGAGPEHMRSHVEKITVPARHILLEGPAKISSGGHGWTVERCGSKDQQKLAEQMNWTANKMELALDQISECFGRNVVLSGFSNGGSMAYAIAARDLIPVDAVVALAGCLPTSLRAPMTNTVGIHGTGDTTVKFQNTAAWAPGAGVDWRPVDGGHIPADGLAIWKTEIERRLS